MPSPSKDQQTCCTHVDNTGQTYNLQLPPVTLAYEDSIHTVCLIARADVLRVNFANGALWQCLQPCPALQKYFRLASLAHSRVSSSDFKPKWQLLGHERHLLVQFLGFDFVLLSHADASWWNAVVVVLTCRKMNSHGTTKQNFPFLSEALVCFRCITSQWVLHVSWTQLCLYSKKKKNGTKENEAYSPQMYCN